MCLAFLRASRAYVPSGLCFVPAFIFLRALRVLIFYVLYMPLFFTCFMCLHFLRALQFLPEDGIHIFAIFLHTHLAGKH